jgi:hypothetical protein
MPSLPLMPMLPEGYAGATASIDYVTYVAERLTGNGEKEEVWCWRPHDQIRAQTFQKLLERYEQSANIRWK